MPLPISTRYTYRLVGRISKYMNYKKKKKKKDNEYRRTERIFDEPYKLRIDHSIVRVPFVLFLSTIKLDIAK